MKFEKDFDFESANAQFNKEEIDREFHNKLKLKVEDKLEKQEKPVNGEDKGDSGADTQNSEGNADEEDPLGPNCYYDKTKSFFDNISCDDNRERRPTWAEERRLNAETFGIPFVQTVAVAGTEAEEFLVSMVAEDVVVVEVAPSPPLKDFVGDSEEVVGAGNLQILYIGKTTKLLHSLQTSLWK
uniref:Uncharacterized protein n=1 Tax=Pipistrellus kuhlii TaxID=59472 RepID=A0A7J8B1W4_PIPKU|nr:hypothetical protein mPipKuh1_007877 [Pipistrellus kuhlii]